ncbi:ribosomal-processing cysteine protease Prp [Veillonella montpellierensis]|uniref:ribosomal-processing cysteine protease Prp n=1 Tax=Veillonella montpellierensis TaxID=187328 RepID=UPI0023F84EB8|nr:ribosomal-processing cysteine protease Prp [Veillonella montpellierensis]
MISIIITRNSDKLIRRCQIEGHAEYDDPGYDIVCAAVSVLSCTAILGLQDIAHQEGHYTNTSGQCDIILSGVLTQSGQDILETMILGLTEISNQYSDFVTISDK